MCCAFKAFPTVRVQNLTVKAELQKWPKHFKITLKKERIIFLKHVYPSMEHDRGLPSILVSHSALFLLPLPTSGRMVEEQDRQPVTVLLCVWLSSEAEACRESCSLAPWLEIPITACLCDYFAMLGVGGGHI